jgi:hypothetical protein
MQNLLMARNRINFFKEQFEKLKRRNQFLFPAEGEGRNAVFAAKLGWECFAAFDISSEKEKTKRLKLADANNVTIDYKVGALETLNYQPRTI